MKVFVLALIAGTVITIIFQMSSSHAILTEGFSKNQLIGYTVLQMAVHTGIMFLFCHLMDEAADERARRTKAFRGYYR